MDAQAEGVKAEQADAAAIITITEMQDRPGQLFERVIAGEDVGVTRNGRRSFYVISPARYQRFRELEAQAARRVA